MFLFDTNILSNVIKKKPSVTLLERLSKTPGNEQFTSCICVLELRYGSRRRTDHDSFWKRIEHEILNMVHVLPITETTAMIAGDIAARLSLDGQSIAAEDLLIASTAVEYEMMLITANEKHFASIPKLRIENWL
jgi:tRNA(fMet)-specific endonuclease VapC